LQQALKAKEKSKGQKKNAQQLLGTNSGQILTGDAMISALLADEEVRRVVKRLPRLLGISGLRIIHGGHRLMPIKQKSMPRILQSGS